MGSGYWTAIKFQEYATRRYGVSADELEHKKLTAQEVFRKTELSDTLKPYGVMRECCDSPEHPNTLPVILALDVTGSMGKAAANTATHLNSIMTEIFCGDEIPDVEFCVMAIGDILYDSAPIQISQFESDIRIAEQMEEVFFEGGGGGNHFESYTAAWYMGLEHCRLDCWKRGKKGLIITMGDELPNPYLSAGVLNRITGDSLKEDIPTKDILKKAKEKYIIYHLSVDDPYSCYQRNQQMYNLDKSWKRLLGPEFYQVVTVDGLHSTISEIVSRYAAGQNSILKAAGFETGHFW